MWEARSTKMRPPRKLKRCADGGSIKRGYDDLGYSAPRGPDADGTSSTTFHRRRSCCRWVPLAVMPLDSTQLKLDEVKRAFLFSQGTPIRTRSRCFTTCGAANANPVRSHDDRLRGESGTVPVHPMRIRVDEKGLLVWRRRAQCGLCLESNPRRVFSGLSEAGGGR